MPVTFSRVKSSLLGTDCTSAFAVAGGGAETNPSVSPAQSKEDTCVSD